MSRLDEFLRLLCGRFDNTRQLEELRRSGSPALPLAEHVNTVCRRLGQLIGCQLHRLPLLRKEEQMG